MALSGILIILLLGFILLLAELFFIPGTTIFGIVGIAVMLAAIILGYYHYGSTSGNLLLLFTLVSSLISVFLAMKFFESGSVGLEAVINSKVNDPDMTDVIVGAKGKAFGDIKPMGKAYFSERIFEVVSQTGYIDDGAMLEIKKIIGNKIYVIESK